MKLTKYFIVILILFRFLISCTKEDVKDIKAADQIHNQTEKTFATGEDGLPVTQNKGGG